MKRRSFIGWLAAVVAGLIAPVAATASAISRPKTGRWEELTQVWWEMKDVEGGRWVYQLIWHWDFGRTCLWPEDMARTHWLIRIEGSPRDMLHHFAGTEEQAKAEAERYTREKLANV